MEFMNLLNDNEGLSKLVVVCSIHVLIILISTMYGLHHLGVRHSRSWDFVSNGQMHGIIYKSLYQNRQLDMLDTLTNIQAELI